MRDIYYEIYRSEVCAWAYDWSDKELQSKIRREKESTQILDDLIFEIKNRDSFNTCIIKEEKNKTYGNKYIKRKYR